MRLIREFVRRYPGQSVVLVAALLLAGVADGIGLSALLPLLNITLESSAGGGSDSALSRFIFDALDTIGVSPSIGVLLSVIVVVVFFKALLVFFAKQRSGYIAAEVSTGLRTDLLKAITNSRWQYFVNQSTGKLANSMATEAWRASNAYVFAVRLLALFVEAGVYTTVALLVSWRATLISFVASFVIVAASHYFVRMAERGGKGQTRWYRSLLGTLTDILQSVKTFKAMGREGSAEEVLSVENNQLRDRAAPRSAWRCCAGSRPGTDVHHRARRRHLSGIDAVPGRSADDPVYGAGAGQSAQTGRQGTEAVSAHGDIGERLLGDPGDYRRRASPGRDAHRRVARPRLDQAIELRDVSFVYGDNMWSSTTSR